jgi:hypothetical protein
MAHGINHRNEGQLKTALLMCGNCAAFVALAWRTEWDSNPRESCPSAGFQDRCLKPLGHPSVLRNQILGSRCQRTNVNLAIDSDVAPPPIAPVNHLLEFVRPSSGTPPLLTQSRPAAALQWRPRRRGSLPCKSAAVFQQARLRRADPRSGSGVAVGVEVAGRTGAGELVRWPA